MTEEKTKEVAAWAEGISSWTGVPTSWVWHLAEYHQESYEALRILTGTGDEMLLDEVLSLDNDFNALVLLEIIKQREGYAKWARQSFREEREYSLPPVEDKEFLKERKKAWEEFALCPVTFLKEAGYEEL